ncbi:hypothetical protein CHGG_08605 [Chaetomium globosum CBS 148.51]|uniref:Gylcosyl hydrolase 115 C-terminal domain-containing protein n=1 Tax=Chaetomium globosum (strain ATCC 6205 / CBS 148.51 / DSM 1962 / NBRC 6347 / NRRL 1970) TaxID=306901 RepID=Q2GTU9_CHAGB|nr:uncharacterized protein CHGG_08605 [Chaetomium globosum CBS 148.51]EAQ84591.1 hypothetical protein CHGG_08605 [Chaetomium globosum CBS 148.51]
MRRQLLTGLAVASLPLTCLSLLEERFVAFDNRDVASSQLAITNAPILVSQDDFVGVHIAANSLARDLRDITGVPRAVSNATLSNITAKADIGTVIVAGSADSSLICDLAVNGHIDISDIEGKWETFKTTVIKLPAPSNGQALVIVGSDKRGTIFGIHTLAEQSGQSPYHWFADVPAQKHAQILALNKTTIHGEPTVKYRGLFINDEEPALNTWWARRHNTTRYPLDTEFYAHVFDLLLRLKANYLWPAMWKSFTPPPGNIFFTDDPGNQQLADDYGIVISTSHHEPLQRATNEWNETKLGPWDWSTNKDNITRFMDEGVARAGHNESYFTIGLRGLGDEAANTENAIEMLKDVFETQRGIIKKYHGSETAVNQVWALYKEVASYDDAGLKPAEDITLLFPDDNQENVYRLPTGNEIEREGGSGIYFHFEYVGLPRSYKWHNTNNLAKVYKELSHAHLRGANQIWIMNVGDIKPIELPLNLAMDLAWNASSISYEYLPSYLAQFAAREIGSAHAGDIAEVLMEHSRLIGMRRYEHITPATYSTLNYHEAERILALWQSLAAQVRNVASQLDPNLHPAFFQLVGHPVLSGATYHSIAINTAFNYRYALERRNSANLLASQVLADFETAYDLVEEWDDMLEGKWADMMSQAVYDAVEEPKMWANPSRDILANLSYVQLRQNMQFSLGSLGLYAEGSSNPVQQGRWAESVDASMPTTDFAPVLPQMDPYGPSVRHVDVFMRGDYRVPLTWALDPLPVPWLSITPANGTLNKDHPDARLNESGPRRPGTPILTKSTSQCSTSRPLHPSRASPNQPATSRSKHRTSYLLPTTLLPPPPPPPPTALTTKPPPPSPSSPSPTSAHAAHPAPSRSRPFLAARANPTAAQSAYATYPIYLFTPSANLTATIYINAGLDTDPNLKMAFSLTFDDQPANFTRVLGESPTRLSECGLELGGGFQDPNIAAA